MYLYHVFAVCQLYRDGCLKRNKKNKNLLQVPLSSSSSSPSFLLLKPVEPRSYFQGFPE